MDRSIRREIRNFSISFWLDTKLDILINRLSNSKIDHFYPVKI